MVIYCIEGCLQLHSVTCCRQLQGHKLPLGTVVELRSRHCYNKNSYVLEGDLLYQGMTIPNADQSGSMFNQISRVDLNVLRKIQVQGIVINIYEYPIAH